MRVVNPYKIRLVTTGTTIEDKQIVIPVGDTFDGVGQNQQVEDYVEKLADDSINPIVDYEKMRYTPYSGTSANSGVTETMGYDFYFYGKPSWVDYDIKNDDSSSTSGTFDSTWGGNTSMVYDNKTSFKYTIVNGVLIFKMSSVYIQFADITNNLTQTDANNILNSNEFTFNTYVAGSPANPVVPVYNISPIGNATDSTTSLINYTIWKRYFNVTVNVTLGNIPVGAQIELKIRTITSGIIGAFGGYKVDYKATSTTQNEGYYTSYTADKIQSLYIQNSFKGYTNSYFRLDYYDSVIEESQNLLFTDVLTVSEGAMGEALFSTKLNKQNYFLYWLKNDPIIEEQGYRDVYMLARFFNASTGQIQQFFNLEDGWQPLTVSDLPTVDEYETMLKYVKIRLFKDYTYIVCKRSIALPTGQNTDWFINDDTSVGVNKIILNQIRLK